MRRECKDSIIELEDEIKLDILLYGDCFVQVSKRGRKEIYKTINPMKVEIKE